MDAREQVLKRTIALQPDGKTIHCFQSVLIDEIPITPKLMRT
jgi:hypothetical protein